MFFRKTLLEGLSALGYNSSSLEDSTAPIAPLVPNIRKIQTRDSMDSVVRRLNSILYAINRLGNYDSYARKTSNHLGHLPNKSIGDLCIFSTQLSSVTLTEFHDGKVIYATSDNGPSTLTISDTLRVGFTCSVLQGGSSPVLVQSNATLIDIRSVSLTNLKGSSFSVLIPEEGVVIVRESLATLTAVQR